MEQYINKAAVVAEIKRRIQFFTEESGNSNSDIVIALFGLKSFLDTLEVKEVDFERELSKYVSNGIHRFFPNEDDDYCKMESFIWQDYVIETAKYFFELGIKTKGG